MNAQALLNDPMIWAAAGLVIVALVWQRYQSQGGGGGGGSILPGSRPSAADALGIFHAEVDRLARSKQAEILATSKAKADLAAMARSINDAAAAGDAVPKS